VNDMAEPFFTERLLNSLLIAAGHTVFLPALLWALRVKSTYLRQSCFGIAVAHSFAGLFLVSPFTFVHFQYVFHPERVDLIWLGVLQGADLQITAGWLAIAIILLGSRAVAALRAHRALIGLIHLRRRHDTALLRDLRGLACRLHVREPRLAVVDGFSSTPFVAGFLRPVVVFPAKAREVLDDGEAHAVLAHELAHARRHDTLVNLLVEVARAILFFNPFFAWLVSRYRTEVEKTRDIEACASGLLRSQLASGLLKIQGLCETATSAPALAAFSTFTLPGRRALERRLRSLAASRRTRRAWVAWLQACVLLFCVAPAPAVGVARNAIHIGRTKAGVERRCSGYISLTPTPGLIWLLLRE
jgi:beta-lactamase regulating signal transducer with metallopeptidase domain